MSTTVPLYHHSRPLKSVVYGKVEASPEHADEFLKDAYSWLEKEVSFYPLFLSVGRTDEDIRMTMYQRQWAKVIGSDIVGRRNDGTYIQRNILRKKGEFPNEVLFSFADVDGVFMDYVNWHLVLNSEHKDYQMTNYEKRLIFKPSWPKSRWLRRAKDDPHSVQFVTPGLYLPEAERIWVRNKPTRTLLQSMGFEKVEVKRLLLEE